MPEFRTAYGEKKQVTTINDKPSMTKQSLVENANINKIIKRFGYGHVVTNMQKLEGIYGDITSQSLKDASDMMIKASEAFQEVPSDIRKKFGNDPGAFIDYATNNDNIDQLIQWGLAKPPDPIPEPIKVEVTNPPPSSE